MKICEIRSKTLFSAMAGMLAFATLCPVRGAVLVVPPSTPDHLAATPYDTWGNASTNIQTAVTYAEANSLTEVWVSNGYYRLPGGVTVTKGINLRSYNEGQIDRTNTIIDGNDAYRAFYLSHANAVLDGFTVTNCNPNPALGQGNGAAVYIDKGGIIRNCDFAFNRQVSCFNTYGGTVGMKGGSVENCLFRENRIPGYGGGINMLSGTMLVTNCTFNGNYASLVGGGINTLGGIGQIVDCVFTHNSSPQGGGLSAYVYSGALTALVERCVFNSNTNDSTGYITHGGGGVRISAQATVTLRNCLITGNRGINTYGGGVFFYNATNSWVENCTIVSNSSSYYGGGIAVSSYGSPLYVGVGIRNTIIYDNWSGAAGGVSNVSAFADHLMWTNNCVGTAINLNNYGAGNLLQIKPKFINPAAKDWHLLQGSPCVDKGDTLDWMTTAKDLDGARRIRNGVVDMGCFESAYSLGTVILVQ